jgi:N-sulfoglucosamine sulfohydrolase
MWRAALLVLIGLLQPQAGWARSVEKPASSRPNFVIIMFDDMSPRIGAFGDRVAHTPNLDAFARTAIRYPNTFTTSPVCAPSRAALFSGRHQQGIGAQHMRTRGISGLPGHGPVEYDAVPPPEVKWFPELLRGAGYYTINVGKTDYQIGNPATIWDVNAMDADWRKRPDDQPFLAFINLQRTHESFLWPQDMRSDNALIMRLVQRNRAMLAGQTHRTDPARVHVPAYLPDHPVIRAEIARVYDNITLEDESVGRIVAALKQDGDFDNTVIIVTADHGDGLPRVKRAIYDAGLRVPLMVRLPGAIAANSRRDELISFVDLAPTILSLAGLTPPRWMQGQAFLGPAKAAPNRYVFAGADRFDEVPEWQRTAIDGRYQYVRNLAPAQPFFRRLAFRDVLPSMQALWRMQGDGSLPPDVAQYFTAPRLAEELYDLRRDPDTVRNLASDPQHGRILRRMRAQYERWTRAIGDDSRLDERAMVARMWRGSTQPVTAMPTITLAGSKGKREARISSRSPGASIRYRIGDGSWRLYTRPVSISEGAVIEASAVRYGFTESSAARLIVAD